MHISLARGFRNQDLRAASLEMQAWHDGIVAGLAPHLRRLSLGRRLRDEDTLAISRLWNSSLAKNAEGLPWTEGDEHRAERRLLYLMPGQAVPSPHEPIGTSDLPSGNGSMPFLVLRGLGIRSDRRRVEVVSSSPRLLANRHALDRWLGRGTRQAGLKDGDRLQLTDFKRALNDALPLCTFWLAAAWARARLAGVTEARGEELATAVILPVGSGLALGSMVMSEHLAGRDQGRTILSVTYDHRGRAHRQGFHPHEMGGPVEIRIATWVGENKLRGSQIDLISRLRGLLGPAEAEIMRGLLTRTLVPFSNSTPILKETPLASIPAHLMGRFHALINSPEWRDCEGAWMDRKERDLRAGDRLTSWGYGDTGGGPWRLLAGSELLAGLDDPKAVLNTVVETGPLPA